MASPTDDANATLSCSRRGCKSHLLGYKCAIEGCDVIRCVECTESMCKKNDFAVLFVEQAANETNATPKMVILCTKKHYLRYQKQIEDEKGGGRIAWKNDGVGGPLDTLTSESILLEWLTTEGNYSKFHGKGNTGKTKKAFAESIANHINSKGVQAVRTVLPVYRVRGSSPVTAERSRRSTAAQCRCRVSR